MDDAEWERRFIAHIMQRSGVDYDGAKATFDAIPIDEWRDSVFIDAPEDAAEEEMSNWDDDES